jgi:hypothetical protein
MSKSLIQFHEDTIVLGARSHSPMRHYRFGFHPDTTTAVGAIGFKHRLHPSGGSFRFSAETCVLAGPCLGAWPTREPGEPIDCERQNSVQPLETTFVVVPTDALREGVSR